MPGSLRVVSIVSLKARAVLKDRSRPSISDMQDKRHILLKNKIHNEPLPLLVQQTLTDEECAEDTLCG
ncbi:uncharacterized protein PHALS_09283 [Plasmopara halstedii]|uniref:Uncharacterized protein n=1 Tax=Plasmopara halstedii TaxID=4781 RepID=A0A0P1AFE9_PLAHL|nr:uncharacterized protein PHALS_09283 [Plasmopara halstedii]CEG39230.1 hypothetical protein PHALS_09283 [Plasmopara halstedii]|eukprot:XP_024575599.1 hypothetical protein PHALS_09283 [Plasmopara halstedii]